MAFPSFFSEKDHISIPTGKATNPLSHLNPQRGGSPLSSIPKGEATNPVIDEGPDSYNIGFQSPKGRLQTKF